MCPGGPWPPFASCDPTSLIVCFYIMSRILGNTRFIVVWWDHYWFIIWSHQFDLNYFIFCWPIYDQRKIVIRHKFAGGIIFFCFILIRLDTLFHYITRCIIIRDFCMSVILHPFLKLKPSWNCPFNHYRVSNIHYWLIPIDLFFLNANQQIPDWQLTIDDRTLIPKFFSLICKCIPWYLESFIV